MFAPPEAKLRKTVPEFASRPPSSPFHPRRVHDRDEDDWARFPPGWPHLIIDVDDDGAGVYSTRMRHLDGRFVALGGSTSDLQKAKLRVEYSYIELALAARLTGFNRTDKHVSQCCKRLLKLSDLASGRLEQEYDCSPLRYVSKVPDEDISTFEFPLYYPHITSDFTGDSNYYIARRRVYGELPFDPYATIDPDNAINTATYLLIKHLYLWEEHKSLVADDAYEIHCEACERRNYESLVEDEIEPNQIVPDPDEYFYMPK